MFILFASNLAVLNILELESNNDWIQWSTPALREIDYFQYRKLYELADNSSQGMTKCLMQANLIVKKIKGFSSTRKSKNLWYIFNSC